MKDLWIDVYEQKWRNREIDASTNIKEKSIKK